MKVRLKELESGVIPALATPFTADAAAVDFISLRRLVEHVQRGGVRCAVSCGSTGEAVALSDAEYSAVIKATREIFQGTLIAGCGASSTARTIELGLLAREAGAQALLVVNPPYNKPTPAGLLAHYRAVSKRTELPIILYNVPSRTGMNVPSSVIVELANDSTLAGYKDSTGSIEQLTEIASRVSSDFLLLSGEDSLILPALSVGARGVISVAANAIPEETFAVVRAVERGDLSAARAAQFKIFPLVKALFAESNPIPLKSLLRELGIIEFDTPRSPLLPASGATKDLLRSALSELKSGRMWHRF